MPLAAPASLTLSSVSATAAALAWGAVTGADSYDVYRAKATAAGAWGSFSKINDSAVLTNAYTDNAANSTPDPVAGASYVYYVVAVDGSGSGLVSNVVNATFAAAAARVAGDLEDSIAEVLAQDPMAEEATYTRYGHAPVTIKGWYDAEASPVDAGAVSLRNSRPQFVCATASVENAGNKDLLAIQGITFYVKAVHPDGAGLTVLELSKNAG